MAKPVINYRAKAIQDRVNNTTVYSPLVEVAPDGTARIYRSLERQVKFVR